MICRGCLTLLEMRDGPEAVQLCQNCFNELQKLPTSDRMAAAEQFLRGVELQRFLEKVGDALEEIDGPDLLGLGGGRN
mgnify:CR=1 FL=1